MNEYRLKRTIDTYQKRALDYQDRFMEMDIYYTSYDRFCELLEQDATVLDVGCGPGTISRYLLNKLPKLRLMGIDLAPKMVELAKANVPQAQFQLMDCRNIACIGQSFDALICGFGLPYLSKEEAKQLIEDAAKLLIPNGILYISTMEGDYERSGYETTSFSGDDEVFIYYHQASFLRQCLAEAGFSLLELQEIDYPEPDGSLSTDLIFLARKR